MEMETIKSRINTLFMVLIYTTEKSAMLSDGERIMINQERGYLMSLFSDTPLNERKVPPRIERKINTIQELIKVTGWEAPKEEY